MRRVERIADSDLPVLLEGDSGTGKELVARELHRRSTRAARPFVAINCAAIPENMLEAVLFGYEKGAFTGADSTREGRLLYANGGTVFLDEIESMPLALQTRLLRVIQEREVEVLGHNAPRPLDVRFVAATKSDLKALGEKGEFRSDLYYRLAASELDLPPLRDRGDDVGVVLTVGGEHLRQHLHIAAEAVREHRPDRAVHLRLRDRSRTRHAPGRHPTRPPHHRFRTAPNHRVCRR